MIPPAATPDDHSTVKRRAVRGAVWTVPTSLVSRAIGLIGTLVLASFLDPAEYGVLTAAAVVVMTANALTNFGVGIYIVSSQQLTRAAVFHATCWFLTTGLLAVTLALVFSTHVGAWAGAPDLSRFMPMYAMIMILERIVYIPERLLVRQLRFARLSIVRAVAELLYTFVAVALAAAGAGAVAIVWGGLARTVVRFVTFVPAVDPREWLQPVRIRLATLLEIVRHGVTVAGAGLASFAMRRWDNLLVSKYFGPEVMGTYNYAYNLADTPAVAVGEQLGDVIGASFPHLGSAQRAAALVRSSTMVSFVMFPLAFGLGAVGPTLAAAFFPGRWQNIGLMLMFLSVISAARPLGDILQSYFYAGNRSAIVLAVEWVSLAAMLVTIPAIGRFGIAWTCSAVSAVFVFRAVAATWLMHYLEGAPISRVLRPMLTPLLLSVAMALAILAIRPSLAGAQPWLRLIIEIGLGGAVYVAGAGLLARSTVAELFALLRSALPRRW